MQRGARSRDEEPASASPDSGDQPEANWKDFVPQAAPAQRTDDEKVTEIAAVRLLARREHSKVELKRKLQHKGHSVERVDRIVDKLAGKKLVCDERFAASVVAYRARRGQGPIRIRAELKQQGATQEAIDAALGQANVDWENIARLVRRRKFGALPNGAAERAKQSRFLQYRGFSSDQIRVALSGSDDCGMDEPSPVEIDFDLD